MKLQNLEFTPEQLSTILGQMKDRKLDLEKTLLLVDGQKDFRDMLQYEIKLTDDIINICLEYL